MQAGTDSQTDSEWVQQYVSLPSVVHPEVYRLKLAASPHIAARDERQRINVSTICEKLPRTKRPLLIEGAGGYWSLSMKKNL